MNKVYTYSQKIFKSLAVLAVIFGVTSCATSNYTAASSGETDGVYYSPSKDGQVKVASNESAQDYEIKVGGAYFDANGNGAEDFYYAETPNQSENQTINIYNGVGSSFYNTSSSYSTTDWGRNDGVEITINNWGWSDPFWGYYGYPGWRFGWTSSYFWGGPRWYVGINPYWGWGGYYGYYSPYYYNYYGPYWGHYPYYGGYYYGGYYYAHNYRNGWYYGRNRVNPGVRPGSNLALGNNYNYRGNFRNGLNSVNTRDTRPVRTGVDNNVRANNGNVRTTTPSQNSSNAPRPVRATSEVRTNNGEVRNSNTPVRTQTQQNTGSNSQVRPVRAAVPNEIRTNPPVRTQQNSNIRTNNNTNSTPRNQNNSIRSNNSNSSYQQSTPTRSSSSNYGSSSGSTRSSGNMSGGSNRGGSRR